MPLRELLPSIKRKAFIRSAWVCEANFCYIHLPLHCITLISASPRSQVSNAPANATKPPFDIIEFLETIGDPGLSTLLLLPTGSEGEFVVISRGECPSPLSKALLSETLQPMIWDVSLSIIVFTACHRHRSYLSAER